MRMVRSVTGDIEPDRLGWCQCHEHIFIADGPARRINSALLMDDVGRSLAEVQRYKKAGGQSFVDAQPYGCGRMAANLVTVSERSGVSIIACTGFHKTEFFEDIERLIALGGDELTRIYSREVNEAMDEGNGTAAKAGLIKCAAIAGTFRTNALYAKLFESTAEAARETGAPILVHFDSDADAMELIEFFGRYDISPERLIFCHLDRAHFDVSYHSQLAQAGVYLEYDTIHREKYHSDEEELQLIEEMVSRGYGSRLLLGLDTTNQRLKSYGAAFGLDDILIRFRYLLEERIGSDTVFSIMTENPGRALCFEQR